MLWQWGNIFYWDIDNDSDSAGMLACSYIRISFKVAIAQICFHFSQRRMSGQVRGTSKGSLRTFGSLEDPQKPTGLPLKLSGVYPGLDNSGIRNDIVPLDLTEGRESLPSISQNPL